MRDYDEVAYPSSRRLTFDFGKVGLAKHHVKAFLAVDVTEARSRIRAARRSAKHISFFAWLIKLTADCVARHPEVNAYNRPSKNTVVHFRDVDVSIAVEKEVNGTLVPLPYVVRQANSKVLDAIAAEIEAATSQKVQDEGQYVLGKGYAALGMRLFVALPQWFRLVLLRSFFFNDPYRMKAAMGTVMITTVGMIGHARGWIVPFSVHPLCLAFGSLSHEAAVFQGSIQQREILHLTVLVDHDVVDGAPAARFMDDLVRSMESASGIDRVKSPEDTIQAMAIA